jgi:signal transduction histidine kinase
VDGIRSGWGLIGLRERVSQLGGTVEVASGADAGTRVSVAIPDRVGAGIRVGADHE